MAHRTTQPTTVKRYDRASDVLGNSLAMRLADSFDYMRPEEVDLVHRLARDLPERAVCVNIGSGSGTSIIAVMEVRLDLNMYSVDINADNALSQFHQAGILSKITQITGDSKTVAWNGDRIDYCFVDAGHLEHEIRGDIQAWIPRMASGGIVLFHDYGSDRWSDVKKVVDEYAGNWEFIEVADKLAAFRIP